MTGWEEGVGLAIQSFWTFRWMKGMRYDEGDKYASSAHSFLSPSFVPDNPTPPHSLTSSLRSLGRERIHLDAMTYLLPLAIERGVFEDDVLELHKTPEMVDALPSLPYVLKIKPEMEKEPVFLTANREHPATYQSILCMVNKVTGWLGWARK